MKSAERRYRRWLRVLPKEYCDVRGEEILSTLLDAASEGRRHSPWDFLELVAHGVRVRLVLTAKRFGRGRLPPSVRAAIACLIVVAVLNLLASVTGHTGAKNSGGHIGNVVVGIVLIGLCVVLKTWSRLLYGAVMGALVVLMSANFVDTNTLNEVNVVVPLVLLVFPLVLLAVGWRRFVATTPRVSVSTPLHRTRTD